MLHFVGVPQARQIISGRLYITTRLAVSLRLRRSAGIGSEASARALPGGELCWWDPDQRDVAVAEVICGRMLLAPDLPPIALAEFRHDRVTRKVAMDFGELNPCRARQDFAIDFPAADDHDRTRRFACSLTQCVFERMRHDCAFS